MEIRHPVRLGEAPRPIGQRIQMEIKMELRGNMMNRKFNPAMPVAGRASLFELKAPLRFLISVGGYPSQADAR